MNKVLTQAELLGEAILASDEYTSMRLAEQAVMDDAEAQKLIEDYSTQKSAYQQEMAKQPLDQAAMAKAGEAMKEMEDTISAHPLISVMRDKSNAYSDMMQQLNAVIARVVNGEPEDSGCGGGCEGCGGSCSH